MAKRFLDTVMWEKAKFRKLEPRLKCAWVFLIQRCDMIGIWEIDLDTMEHFIGEPISLAEILESFDVRRVGDDKLFLPGFVSFQYGELQPTNNLHRSVISRLSKLGLDPNSLAPDEDLTSPSRGDKEKNKNKDKEKEKEIQGGVGGILPEHSAYVAPAAEIDREAVDVCIVEWLETLAHFKAGRKNVSAQEELEIVRAIQRQKSVKAVHYALRGVRHQEKTLTYDPSKFLNLATLLRPERIEALTNLGVQATHKSQGRAS